MEQFNKILKKLLRALGSNVDEKNAERLANAIQEIEAVLESVDKYCSLSEKQGCGSKGKPEETVEQILKDLIEKSVFKHIRNRYGHPSFPKFHPNLLEGLDYRDFHKWMMDTISKWKYINGNS